MSGFVTFFFNSVKTYDITEHLEGNEARLSLPLIRLVERHVIVGSGADVFDVLHIVIHTLDHMMTGRTERDKILPLLLRVVKRADGGKLCCDLIGSQGINTAATLPLADLFQFKSQSFCGNSGIVIKILCLVLQSTAGKIAVFIVLPPRLSGGNDPPCYFDHSPARNAREIWD